ncbi:sensor histidine kinase [Mesoterricola silvestris]|uniref:histidine kinase n=1 Tax=Mesoterricola silvestris TaxID=2927979 RepID=A0AA48GK31_9BACT|nr:ATP-binding protein [Mesoterricola silvestris]BDU71204.1 hypothetical protein METEAL_03780 [Mesoterricola silvestris]
MPPLLRIAAAFLLTTALWPQGPGRPPARHYGKEDGLLSEVVTAMALTTDGQIWAGTEAGLTSFEGHQFAPYVGQLPSPVTTDLFADADGSLWVATDGGVARIRNRRSELLGEAEGLPRGFYRKLGRDARGHLWVLSTDSLYAENGPMRFVKAPALPVPERPVHLFADPSDPSPLVITPRHILEWDGAAWAIVPGPPLGAKEEFLNHSRDGLGCIWVRSSRAMWQRREDGTWHRVRANMTGGFSFSSRPDRDSRGWVWFDDADGLWRMKGDARERHGRPGDDAKGGMVDREHGIWIRTDHGVQRNLGRSRWTGYDAHEGLAGNLAWQPLRDATGRLWVATDKGLCVATDQGFRQVLPGRFLSLALAPDGHLWAAGSPGGTVHELDPATLAVHVHTVSVLPRGRITAGLAIDADGTPWVADRFKGLARGIRSGTGWTWAKARIDGRDVGEVLGLAAVPGGGMAVLHDGTASMLREGAWRTVPGLLPDTPGALAFGPGGRFVVSYRNPYLNRSVVTLHRLRGEGSERIRIVPVQGLASDPLMSIFSVGMDPDGHIWVGTNKGLGELPSEDAPGFRMIGMEDRLVSPECNEWAMLAERGRVWAGTTSGLVAYDSSQMEIRPVLKEPMVLQAWSGSRELDLPWSAPDLARKSNMLELKFMIPTYQAPGKIWHEARLLGVDPDWIRQEEGHLRYAGLSAGRHTLELRGVLPDCGIEGPVLTLNFTVVPAWWETPWARTLGLLALGGTIGLLFWLRSVSLRTRNRQLQEEVARQTRALQEASKAKSAFLANMSHELRTPLNAILLYSELLQEEAKERGLDSTIRDAGRISQAGSSLLNLIDDILDISKIEAGHMKIEIRDLAMAPFLAGLDSALRPVVERNGNMFRVSSDGAPAVLATDPTRLQQILANLLSNAAKFTDNGSVVLTVSQEPGWVVFTVEDTGIGMTPEEQRRVFSEFVQADSSTTRKYGGTGLGLTLVQRLTEMLGGRVDLESEAGKGTRVRVRIPATPVR